MNKTQQIIVGTREFFNAWKDPNRKYIIVGGYGNGILVYNSID